MCSELGKPPARTSCHRHHPEFTLVPLLWWISHFVSAWLAASLGPEDHPLVTSVQVKILRPSDLKKICIGYLSECQMLDWKSFALSIKKSLPSCPPVSSTSLLYRVSLALFLKSVVPFWVDALLFLLGNRVLQILGNFLELFL